MNSLSHDLSSFLVQYLPQDEAAAFANTSVAHCDAHRRAQKHCTILQRMSDWDIIDAAVSTSLTLTVFNTNITLSKLVTVLAPPPQRLNELSISCCFGLNIGRSRGCA